MGLQCGVTLHLQGSGPSDCKTKIGLTIATKTSQKTSQNLFLPIFLSYFVRASTCVGNENSARSFPDRSFFEPRGHGRPRLRVMDVRTETLVFPGFRGLDRSSCPRTSAGISAWTSAGYPAPKLTLWVDFPFLSVGPAQCSRAVSLVLFESSRIHGDGVDKALAHPHPENWELVDPAVAAQAND